VLVGLLWDCFVGFKASVLELGHSDSWPDVEMSWCIAGGDHGRWEQRVWGLAAWGDVLEEV
jgi:hypothetical protein